jgi:UDP-4-keto-D-FucNAc 4-reductase
MKIFVTGASGFVGRTLVKRLVAAGHDVTAFSRRVTHWEDERVVSVQGDINDPLELHAALAGHQAIVHLAARAHVVSEDSSNPLEVFRRVNRDATLAVARAGLEVGVEHFVFLSSIGVNGTTSGVTPFDETSPVKPTQPYAVSKLEAEDGLRALVSSGQMALTIIRPPLVYGAGAPGNMRRLLRMVAHSIPLPLANARAAKSFVSVESLSDFVVLAVGNAAAANRLFLVADSDRISTESLVRAMAAGMGKRAWLFPVPGGLIKLAARTPGVGGTVRQLFMPLEVDSSAARAALNWSPAPTLDGITPMARTYATSPW